jgi:hypothetical protein
MRWKGLRRSSNVDDIRGAGGGGPQLRMPLRLGGRRGGGGSLLGLVVIVGIAWFVGGPDMVMSLLGGGGTVAPASSGAGLAPRPPPAADEQGQFIATMLGSTEDVWGALFGAAGSRYEAPRLVLFTDGVQSACGYNASAVGPFYCPPDRNVYLDTAFFAELARMGGAGDFAQAYVIGHEVGHHVQNITGIADAVARRQRQAPEAERNRLQVRMELQADCYAGVWAHHANRQHRVLEPGDVEEGLAAAQAIGDDTLLRNAGRAVRPESFTHGSAAERMRWLRIGLDSGDVEACDTFAGG